MMTKLCSGQGKRDNADDAADQSNTYMSPFQATQKDQDILYNSMNIYFIDFLNHALNVFQFCFVSLHF